MAQSEEIVVNDAGSIAGESILPENLASTLCSVVALTEQVAPLKRKAQEIEATTADTYRQVGQVLTEVRGLRKQGASLFAPFDSIVERAKNFLKLKRQSHELACDEVAAICLGKMKTYERAEADASEKEQAALNKKSPKGQAAVTVKPNIPSTPGYRRTTNYRIELTDSAVKLFLRAIKAGRKDLIQYVVLDQQALAAQARSMKDEEKFMELYPGVRCCKE